VPTSKIWCRLWRFQWQRTCDSFIVSRISSKVRLRFLSVWFISLGKPYFTLSSCSFFSCRECLESCVWRAKETRAKCNCRKWRFELNGFHGRWRLLIRILKRIHKLFRTLFGNSMTKEVNVFNFKCMHILFLQGLLFVPLWHSSVHSTFLPLHRHPRELFSFRLVVQAFAFTKSRRRFLSKRNSRSWAFALYKADLNAKYMQNSSTHRYFHNGGRAWQVSERGNTTAHVNPWQYPFKTSFVYSKLLSFCQTEEVWINETCL